MKNRIAVFGAGCLSAVMMLLVTSCGSDDGAGGPDVHLRASLPASRSSFHLIPDWIMMTPHAFTTASADRIMVLVSNNSFRTVTLSSTSIDEDVGFAYGGPLGVVFIENNAILGTLNLTSTAGDFNVLPLTKLNGTVVDLGNITFSTRGTDKLAIPEIDPISENGVINLNATEKASVALMNNTLSSILRNPDINKDGTIDFLQDRYYRFSFQYHFRAGRVPAAGTDGDFDATFFPSARLDGFYTRCSVNTSGQAGSLTSEYPITFPAGYPGTPGNSTGQSGYTQDSGGGDATPPVSGAYTVTAGAEGTLEFQVVDQSDAINDIIVPVPTYHVSGGKLQRITWNWKLRSNISGSSVDPTAVISGLSIQVNDTLSGITRIYNSYGGDLYPWAGTQLTGAEGDHVLGNPNVPWADSDRIDFAYNDKFGNHVVVQFERPSYGN